jgi:hypothetical protein
MKMNLNNVNWKTVITPIVAAGALLYGTITGHEVSQSLQNTIIIDGAAIIGFGVTVWGIWKNHKKDASK